MGYDFNNGTPIYLQIIEDLKMQIISKKYLPKQKIPSVRDLSMQYGANPNTIQKALAELESAGLIVTERTNGKFVTSDIVVIEQIKESTINKMISEFYGNMQSIGLDKSAVLEILNKERL